MSNVITELAVITSKAKGAANNKDSVNMNGRVLTLQEADKGYKGAGSFNAPCVLALASSVRDGYSAAALTALNERMQSIRDSESGFKNAIDLYFSDASYALTRLDAGENALSLAVLYTYGNSISVARLGGDVIYRRAGGMVVGVASEDVPSSGDGGSFGYEDIAEPTDDETFVILSEGAASVISQSEIEVIMSAGAPIRETVNEIYRAIREKNGGNSISVMIVSVKGIEQTEAFSPADGAASLAAAAVSASSVESVSPSEKVINVDDQISDSDVEDGSEPQPEKKKGAAGKVLLVILVVALMAAVVFAAYKITDYLRDKKQDETTTAPSTTVVADTSQEPETLSAVVTTEPDSETEAATAEPETTAPSEDEPAPTTSYTPSYTYPVVTQVSVETTARVTRTYTTPSVEDESTTSSSGEPVETTTSSDEPEPIETTTEEGGETPDETTTAESGETTTSEGEETPVETTTTDSGEETPATTVDSELTDVIVIGEEDTVA